MRVFTHIDVKMCYKNEIKLNEIAQRNFFLPENRLAIRPHEDLKHLHNVFTFKEAPQEKDLFDLIS